MAAPVLTCVEFAQDGVTCATTAWVQQQTSVLPPLTAVDGQAIGLAILIGCAAIAASKLPRRG
jgi:hypothetical protein